MNKIVGLLGSLLLWWGGCAGEESESSVIYLAHVNDTHGHLEPVEINYSDAVLRVGGYPRIHSQIEAWRELATRDDAGFLFLHAGDAWQGTAWFSLFQGMADLHLLNEMGLDAMVLGNHEFDKTYEIPVQKDGSVMVRRIPSPPSKGLNEFISAATFPVLAANLDCSNDPVFVAQTNLFRSVIREVDGHLVGIVGIVLDEMPSISAPSNVLQFSSGIQAAKECVADLEDQGVNRIIVLSHIGYQADLKLARAVDGIDVIVGGHSHSLLGAFSKSTAPYPTLVEHQSGRRTVVVQAGADAQYAGLLKVTFDAAGEVLNAGGTLCLLALPGSKIFPQDQFFGGGAAVTVQPEHANDVRWIQTHCMPQLQKAYGPIIGTVESDLFHQRVPQDAAGHGSQLAPLLAEGLVHELNRRKISADVALMNAGSIRSSLNAGPLHQNSIPLEVMIFADKITTFELTGKQLKRVLASVIGTAISETGQSGCFPYVARLRYVYDAADSVQNRLQVEVFVEAEGWRQLADDDVLRVAASNYLATGHDHYDLLKTYIDLNNSKRVFNWSARELAVDYLIGLAEENDGLIRGLDYDPVTVRNVKTGVLVR